MQVMKALEQAAEMQPNLFIRSAYEWSDYWIFPYSDSPNPDFVQMDGPIIKIHKITGDSKYMLLSDHDFFDILKNKKAAHLPEGVLPYSARQQ